MPIQPVENSVVETTKNIWDARDIWGEAPQREDTDGGILPHIGGFESVTIFAHLQGEHHKPGGVTLRPAGTVDTNHGTRQLRRHWSANLKEYVRSLLVPPSTP